jgi:hypothetical protein
MEGFMEELNADIGLFLAYAKIAEDNNIQDTQWAAAARTPQPRIAELRRIVRMMAEEGISQAEAQKRIRRTCNYGKLQQLFRGLTQLLGEEIMAHELGKVERKEKSPVIQLILQVSRITLLKGGAKAARTALDEVERELKSPKKK